MSSPARNDKEDERLATIRMSHQHDVRGGTKVLRRNGAGYVPWDMAMAMARDMLSADPER